MNLLSALGWAAAGWLVIATPLAAGEIYRWVDDQGTVHFTDKPPATAQNPVTTLDVDTTPAPAQDPDADPYNIAATAARTQAVREGMSRKTPAQSQTSPAPVVQYAQPQTYGVNYGYPPMYNRPIRPRPPRPVQPIAPEPAPPSTLKPRTRTRG